MPYTKCYAFNNIKQFKEIYFLMNPLERKIGRSKSIESMPNYTTEGPYCFFSQCIVLNSIEKKDLESATQLAFNTINGHKPILKFAPLLHHEAKHWYDAHSTLWGLTLIRDIYSCRNDLYEAENSGIAANLTHFDKQIMLRDSIEYIKYPKYYSTCNSNFNTSKPWSYQLSSGIIFSKHGKPTDRSIFFTRFQNKDGNLIARVPFSLCALLEASAVAQELNTKVLIIDAIKDVVSKKIESKKLLDDTYNDFYDENLVEYSVVAHKVANTFAISDAIEAYNISAKLSRFILNLPIDVIKLLVPKKILSDQFSVFFDAYSSAIKYQDRGSLFPLLVDALFSKYQSEGISVNLNNLEKLLNDLFSNHLNLTLKDVSKRSRTELLEVCKPVGFKLEKRHIDGVLKEGVVLYDKFGLVGDSFINFNKEKIPDFVLGDNTFYSSSGITFNEFEGRYFRMTEYYEYLEKFYKACIV